MLRLHLLSAKLVMALHLPLTSSSPAGLSVWFPIKEMLPN